MKHIRNFSIIAPIVAAQRLPENPRFSVLPSVAAFLTGTVHLLDILFTLCVSKCLKRSCTTPMVVAHLHGKTTVFPTLFAQCAR